MYRLYLKKRYGSDKAAYKGIIASAREQQQSAEIMLSIVMPSLSLPAEDKNMILKYYKEEWDEQIKLIDSLPTENFIRDYLGLKKFRKYVEECIFSPGKLFRTIIANPLAGKWEKISENGVEVKHPIQKEYYDDFSFMTSEGTKGTYRITTGQQLSESSQNVKVKDIIEYSAIYQFEANNQILVLTGEANLKLANGTLKNVQVKETWRRIE